MATLTAGVARVRSSARAVLRRFIAALIVDRGRAGAQVARCSGARPLVAAVRRGAVVARTIEPERLADGDRLAEGHDTVPALAIQQARAVEPERLAVGD